MHKKTAVFCSVLSLLIVCASLLAIYLLKRYDIGKIYDGKTISLERAKLVDIPDEIEDTESTKIVANNEEKRDPLENYYPYASYKGLDIYVNDEGDYLIKNHGEEELPLVVNALVTPDKSIVLQDKSIPSDLGTATLTKTENGVDYHTSRGDGISEVASLVVNPDGNMEVTSKIKGLSADELIDFVKKPDGLQIQQKKPLSDLINFDKSNPTSCVLSSKDGDAIANLYDFVEDEDGVVALAPKGVITDLPVIQPIRSTDDKKYVSPTNPTGTAVVATVKLLPDGSAEVSSKYSDIDKVIDFVDEDGKLFATPLPRSVSDMIKVRALPTGDIEISPKNPDDVLADELIAYSNSDGGITLAAKENEQELPLANKRDVGDGTLIENPKKLGFSRENNLLASDDGKLIISSTSKPNKESVDNVELIPNEELLELKKAINPADYIKYEKVSPTEYSLSNKDGDDINNRFKIAQNPDGGLAIVPKYLVAPYKEVGHVTNDDGDEVLLSNNKSFDDNVYSVLGKNGNVLLHSDPEENDDIDGVVEFNEGKSALTISLAPQYVSLLDPSKIQSDNDVLLNDDLIIKKKDGNIYISTSDNTPFSKKVDIATVNGGDLILLKKGERTSLPRLQKVKSATGEQYVSLSNPLLKANTFTENDSTLEISSLGLMPSTSQVHLFKNGSGDIEIREKVDTRNLVDISEQENGDVIIQSNTWSSLLDVVDILTDETLTSLILTPKDQINDYYPVTIEDDNNIYRSNDDETVDSYPKHKISSVAKATLLPQNDLLLKGRFKRKALEAFSYKNLDDGSIMIYPNKITPLDMMEITSDERGDVYITSKDDDIRLLSVLDVKIADNPDNIILTSQGDPNYQDLINAKEMETRVGKLYSTNGERGASRDASLFLSSTDDFVIRGKGANRAEDVVDLFGVDGNLEIRKVVNVLDLVSMSYTPDGKGVEIEAKSGLPMDEEFDFVLKDGELALSQKGKIDDIERVPVATNKETGDKYIESPLKNSDAKLTPDGKLLIQSPEYLIDDVLSTQDDGEGDLILASKEPVIEPEINPYEGMRVVDLLDILSKDDKVELVTKDGLPIANEIEAVRTPDDVLLLVVKDDKPEFERVKAKPSFNAQKYIDPSLPVLDNNDVSYVGNTISIIPPYEVVPEDSFALFETEDGDIEIKNVSNILEDLEITNYSNGLTEVSTKDKKPLFGSYEFALDKDKEDTFVIYPKGMIFSARSVNFAKDGSGKLFRFDEDGRTPIFQEKFNRTACAYQSEDKTLVVEGKFGRTAMQAASFTPQSNGTLKIDTLPLKPVDMVYFQFDRKNGDIRMYSRDKVEGLVSNLDVKVVDTQNLRFENPDYSSGYAEAVKSRSSKGVMYQIPSNLGVSKNNLLFASENGDFNIVGKNDTNAYKQIDLINIEGDIEVRDKVDVPSLLRASVTPDKKAVEIASKNGQPIQDMFDIVGDDNAISVVPKGAITGLEPLKVTSVEPDGSQILDEDIDNLKATITPDGKLLLQTPLDDIEDAVKLDSDNGHLMANGMFQPTTGLVAIEEDPDGNLIFKPKFDGNLFDKVEAVIDPDDSKNIKLQPRGENKDAEPLSSIWTPYGNDNINPTKGSVSADNNFYSKPDGTAFLTPKKKQDLPVLSNVGIFVDDEGDIYIIPRDNAKEIASHPEDLKPLIAYVPKAPNDSLIAVNVLPLNPSMPKVKELVSKYIPAAPYVGYDVETIKPKLSAYDLVSVKLDKDGNLEIVPKDPEFDGRIDDLIDVVLDPDDPGALKLQSKDDSENSMPASEAKTPKGTQYTTPKKQGVSEDADLLIDPEGEKLLVSSKDDTNPYALDAVDIIATEEGDILLLPKMNLKDMIRISKLDDGSLFVEPVNYTSLFDLVTPAMDNTTKNLELIRSGSIRPDKTPISYHTDKLKASSKVLVVSDAVVNDYDTLILRQKMGDDVEKLVAYEQNRDGVVFTALPLKANELLDVVKTPEGNIALLPKIKGDVLDLVDAYEDDEGSILFAPKGEEREFSPAKLLKTPEGEKFIASYPDGLANDVDIFNKPGDKILASSHTPDYPVLKEMDAVVTPDGDILLMPKLEEKEVAALEDDGFDVLFTKQRGEEYQGISDLLAFTKADNGDLIISAADPRFKAPLSTIVEIVQDPEDPNNLKIQGIGSDPAATPAKVKRTPVGENYTTVRETGVSEDADLRTPRSGRTYTLSSKDPQSKDVLDDVDVVIDDDKNVIISPKLDLRLMIELEKQRNGNLLVKPSNYTSLFDIVDPVFNTKTRNIEFVRAGSVKLDTEPIDKFSNKFVADSKVLIVSDCLINSNDTVTIAQKAGDDVEDFVNADLQKSRLILSNIPHSAIELTNIEERSNGEIAFTPKIHGRLQDMLDVLRNDEGEIVLAAKQDERELPAADGSWSFEGTKYTNPVSPSVSDDIEFISHPQGDMVARNKQYNTKALMNADFVVNSLGDIIVMPRMTEAEIASLPEDTQLLFHEPIEEVVAAKDLVNYYTDDQGNLVIEPKDPNFDGTIGELIDVVVDPENEKGFIIQPKDTKNGREGAPVTKTPRGNFYRTPDPDGLSSDADLYETPQQAQLVLTPKDYNVPNALDAVDLIVNDDGDIVLLPKLDLRDVIDVIKNPNGSISIVTLNGSNLFDIVDPVYNGKSGDVEFVRKGADIEEESNRLTTYAGKLSADSKVFVVSDCAVNKDNSLTFTQKAGEDIEEFINIAEGRDKLTLSAKPLTAYQLINPITNEIGEVEFEPRFTGRLQDLINVYATPEGTLEFAPKGDERPYKEAKTTFGFEGDKLTNPQNNKLSQKTEVLSVPDGEYIISSKDPRIPTLENVDIILRDNGDLAVSPKLNESQIASLGDDELLLSQNNSEEPEEEVKPVKLTGPADWIKIREEENGDAVLYSDGDLPLAEIAEVEKTPNREILVKSKLPSTSDQDFPEMVISNNLVDVIPNEEGEFVVRSKDDETPTMDVVDFIRTDNDDVEIKPKTVITDLLTIKPINRITTQVRTKSGSSLYDVADTVVNDRGKLLFVPKNALGYGKPVTPDEENGNSIDYPSRLFDRSDVALLSRGVVEFTTKDEGPIASQLQFDQTDRAIVVGPTPLTAVELLDVFADKASNNYVLQTKDGYPVLDEIEVISENGYLTLQGIDQEKGGKPANRRFFNDATLFTPGTLNDELESINFFARNIGDFLVAGKDNGANAANLSDIIAAEDGDIEIRKKTDLRDLISVRKTPDGNFLVSSRDGDPLTDRIKPIRDPNGDIVLVLNNLYLTPGKDTSYPLINDSEKFDVTPLDSGSLVISPKDKNDDIEELLSINPSRDGVQIHPEVSGYEDRTEMPRSFVPRKPRDPFASVTPIVPDVVEIPKWSPEGGNPFVPRFVDYDPLSEFNEDDYYRNEREGYKDNVTKMAYPYLYENHINDFNYETGEYENVLPE